MARLRPRARSRSPWPCYRSTTSRNKNTATNSCSRCVSPLLTLKPATFFNSPFLQVCALNELNKDYSKRDIWSNVPKEELYSKKLKSKFVYKSDSSSGKKSNLKLKMVVNDLKHCIHRRDREKRTNNATGADTCLGLSEDPAWTFHKEKEAKRVGIGTEVKFKSNL